MDPSLKKFLEQFLNFKIFSKKVIIPYWMNKLDKGIYGPYGGKGMPKEIHQATIEAAEKEKVDLRKLSAEQIYSFMKKARIGLDCSGFAYQILDFLDQQKGGDGIGMGIRRTNAATLTNNINSQPIQNYDQVRVGDLLRLGGGGHVAVIIEVKNEEIIYAHISHTTKIEGPHFGKIKILDKKKGLESQVWEEELIFQSQKGDGIRRLKIWG